MKLSFTSIMARVFRETQLRPLPKMPTEDSMYLEHLRRKADDHPRNHAGYERRDFW